MWERSDDSLSNEISEDIHEIMQQLFQLRDVLLVRVLDVYEDASLTIMSKYTLNKYIIVCRMTV